MSNVYTPIKGIGTGFWRLQLAMRTRLYAASDHLLLVQSTGYTEDYKRVFYRDIRYVVAQKTHGQARQAMISGLFLVGAFLLNLTSMPWWLADLFGVPFLIWFVMNWLRGACCQCYVNTEIQTLAISAPTRLNKVPLLIAFLNTKISPGQPEVTQAAT